MPHDLLNQQVAGDIHYSRINNAEVLPGVMTGASWSFWDEAVEVAFRRALFDLGVFSAADLPAPSDPAERLRAVFFGRVATNMSRHKAVGLRMPAFLRTAFIVHLFADETDAEAAPRRSVAWLWRMPWQVARLPARLRAEHHGAKLWWRGATDPARASKDIDAAIGDLRSAHAAFQRAMTLNITTSILSSAPVQQVMAIAKAVFGSRIVR